MMDPLTGWLRSAGTTGVILARSRRAAPWGIRFPQRSDVTFHLIAEGSCWLRQSKRSPLALHQGDLIILPTGAAHDLFSDPNALAEPSKRMPDKSPSLCTGGACTTVLCGSYGLDAHLARPMMRALPEVVHFPAAQVHAKPQLASVLSLLTAEVATPAPGGELLIQHLFDALFLYVVRAWTDQAATGGRSLAALTDPRLSHALARIHAEPAAPWTVSTLARSASLSRAAFARRFSEAIGEPPLAYLTRWRMGVAARLLAETMSSIAEIATTVGYESEFAFSRAFKRSRGMAPGAYRLSERSRR